MNNWEQDSTGYYLLFMVTIFDFQAFDSKLEDWTFNIRVMYFTLMLKI
jgi:hypothetical protein